MHFHKRWYLIVAVLLLIALGLLFQQCSQMVNNNTRGNSTTQIQKRADIKEIIPITTTTTIATKPTITADIYQYVEATPAGGGSAVEELKRLRHHLATQGAVCEHIRRIGGEKINRRPYGPDGAWDVCFDLDIGLFPHSCIVYSIGIAKDFTFDDGMAHYGCKVYSFDPTTGRPDHRRSALVTFFNTGLSDHDQEGNGQAFKGARRENWKTRTLSSVIKELHHEKNFIDILKMDIESDEWTCLPQMLNDGSLHRHVRQLVIEFHLTNNSPEGVRRFYSIVQWLGRQGILVSSLHVNPYCDVCLEMTFINTRLRGIGNSNLNKPKRKKGDKFE